MRTQTIQISYTLDVIRRLNSEYLSFFKQWSNNAELKRLAQAYESHSRRDFDLGLNLFTIISDQYHKENFQSDILALMLEVNGRHKEGDKFLRLFLDI